jgi:hypothetical protein
LNGPPVIPFDPELELVTLPDVVELELVELEVVEPPPFERL